MHFRRDKLQLCRCSICNVIQEFCQRICCSLCQCWFCKQPKAGALVLHEAVLKSDRFKVVGLDGLNAILYAQTTAVYAFMLYWRMQVMGESYNFIVFGLDGSAIGLILLQIALGIVIPRVLKHSSAVAKTIASGGRQLSSPRHSLHELKRRDILSASPPPPPHECVFLQLIDAQA